MGSIVIYFTYGSNTNLPVLRRYLVQHGVDPRGIRNARRAFLDDFRIRTNYMKTGLVGGAAVNVEAAKGKRVEGLLMDISPEVHHLLRRKEGFPHRYREISIFVHLPRSHRLIMAMTYVVAEKYRLRTDMPVHPSYRSIILEGAHRAGFTKKYQRHLSALLRTALTMNL
jgi:hypothetical protein